MTLTEAEIARYHEQGYLVPSYRLPSDVLESTREAYARLLAEHTTTVCVGCLVENSGDDDYA